MDFPKMKCGNFININKYIFNVGVVVIIPIVKQINRHYFWEAATKVLMVRPLRVWGGVKAGPLRLEDRNKIFRKKCVHKARLGVG